MTFKEIKELENKKKAAKVREVLEDLGCLVLGLIVFGLLVIIAIVLQ